MTTLANITAATNSNQVRRNAIAFAQAVGYKVSEMYNEASEAFMNAMSEIHANGKEGNYEMAAKYRVVKETLETWN